MTRIVVSIAIFSKVVVVVAVARTVAMGGVIQRQKIRRRDGAIDRARAIAPCRTRPRAQ